MKPGWTEVALGEVLELDLDAVVVDPSQTYEMVGVLSYGRGLFQKPPVAGSDTSYKTFYRLRLDQIVLSQLFGWEGAIAPVPQEFEGKFVSSQFPTFRTKPNVDFGFAKWILRSPVIWEQLKSSAKGMGDRRRTLSPEIFFAVRSTLPPLAEQQRIVAHLDAIEQRLNRVQKLREESEKEVMGLVRLSLNDRYCGDVRMVPMSRLVRWRKPDTEVHDAESYTFAGVYSFGRGVFRKDARSGRDFAYDCLTQLKAGEFTYPKLMAWEGALGVVPDDCDGCYVSPEFPVFTPDKEQVLPEILDIHFKTPEVWKRLSDLSTGTNVRRRRLNPNAFLSYAFPLPSMETQLRVVGWLQESRMASGLHREAQQRQDALIPSLLESIFN